MLYGRVLPRMPLITAATVGIAVVVGLSLSGHGDGENGLLSLPASSSSAAAGGNGAPPRFTTWADLNVTFVVGNGSQATSTVNEQPAQVPLSNDAVMRSTALTAISVLMVAPPRSHSTADVVQRPALM